jgi:hypothetical protein
MVMVFRTDAILELVREVAPHIHLAFQRIYDAVGTPREETVVREVYRQLKPVNFSTELLEPFVQAHPSRLLTLPIRGVL